MATHTDLTTARAASLPGGPVVIVGGTGKTGSRVANGLQALGVDTRPVSRSTSIRFDWDDPATWDPALSGAGAAYVTFYPDLAFPGADDTIHRFATRAARHGLARVVLLSGRGEQGAQRSEEALHAAISDATVVRCAWFAQNFSEGMLRDSVKGGVIALPAPTELPEPFIDADDIAAVAVHALTTAGQEGEVLELTGPTSVPMGEAADIISRAVGARVEYVEVSPAVFADGAAASGVPREEADALAEVFGELLDGRNVATTDTVRRVLGRQACSLETFAADAAAAGAWR
ncbi:MAG: NmrA family transcriptional regulator [Cellulomonas sp.]|nr:NmrA family transcriptional regulator [Cellulomonas sp.]